ncbi:TonB-dependent receptor plug domain-containing protein [Desulfocicer vacuolatum]|uniref:TonB-dependent receptor plug domain-containing protein n=1 Tax=Desulfocicer vacuolatum TaxID=2298 RepID=UPI001BB0A643|nr:TonB-dependent receptor [Desulfocicer vacuolatum]
MNFPTTSTASKGSDAITITAKEIEAMNVNTMADILNRIPGVRCGDTSVSIHGSSKVKVYVNGKPLNDPTATHGGVRWDMVDIDHIEKIEVFKGKGGVSHGSDAAGGVILISTGKITKFKGSVKTHVGRNDVFNAKTNATMLLGKMGLGLSGEYNTDDGYKLNNDKETHRLGGRLEYSPGDAADFILTADYMNDERGLSGLPDFPTPFSRKETDISIFSLLSSFNAVTAKTYLNQGKKHNTDISKGLDKSIKVKKWGQDIKYNWKFNKNNGFNLGAAWELNTASGTAFSSKEENSLSAFSTWSRSFDSLPITLSMGLRGNYNSDFENAVNPELKIIYKKNSWQISASYNRANNTPSFYHRYNETSSTIPNPDLTMETSNNYELGLSMTHSDALSTHVTLFYNRLKDKITYVRNDYGIGQYQNLGEATYKGGDLGINYRPLEQLAINGSYTYLEAKNEKTGLWLTAKPAHRANVDFNFTPTPKLFFNLNLLYTSKNYTNKSNTRSVSQYLIANARAEYFFQKFSVFSEIENIADTTYYFVDGLLAPPLLWIVGLEYKF